LNQLLTSKDADIRFIAENFDWYVFPSVNPDGYQYSHTTVRIWAIQMFWKNHLQPSSGIVSSMSMEHLVNTRRLWVLDFLLVITKCVVIGDYDQNLHLALSCKHVNFKEISSISTSLKVIKMVMQNYSFLSKLLDILWSYKNYNRVVINLVWTELGKKSYRLKSNQ
jgi:hypothetical protein